MPLYPLFADLAGREVLVVGGGEVAQRKVEALLHAGARVRLHALELHPALAACEAEGRLERLPGSFDPAWIDEAWLVVVATDDAALNAAIAARAGTRRRLVNVVDDAGLSTFQTPAVIERAPLQLAISSGGAAPMLARRLRERLETELDPAPAPGRWTASIGSVQLQPLAHLHCSESRSGRLHPRGYPTCHGQREH